MTVGRVEVVEPRDRAARDEFALVHQQFDPGAGDALEHLERQVVQQFVRDNDADVAQHPRVRQVLEYLMRRGRLGARGRGPLDDHVPHDVGATRLGACDGARESPASTAGFDDRERIRAIKLIPPRVQRTRHDRAEERTDLRAREEVGTAPTRTRTARVKPRRPVQRVLHEHVESDRLSHVLLAS